MTKNVKKHTIEADIVISAVGKPNLLTAEMIKEGAVVIDAGCNKINGKLYGDCDFANIAKKASYLTPVPGGVGPVTTAVVLAVKQLRVRN